MITARLFCVAVFRREFLIAAVAASAIPRRARAQQPASTLTRFQIACMTLPYSAFPFERALQGIRGAGYEFVAWGVNHKDPAGQSRPVIAVEAPPADAAKLAVQTRGEGLTPVMMFSTVNFEEQSAADAYRKRIDQAQSAGIPFIIVFGRTSRGDYSRVIENLQRAAKHATGSGAMLVLKQHGGNTATGVDCSRIIRDVGHESVRMCYDAGNVLDYENHDPIPDIRDCWRDVRAFSIKDHRNHPIDQDCGPGFGEIDHYKLLEPVMQTGLTMPLACENIFAPLVPRPADPEGIDRLANRAREYLETVLAGLTIHQEKQA